MIYTTGSWILEFVHFVLKDVLDLAEMEVTMTFF